MMLTRNFLIFGRRNTPDIDHVVSILSLFDHMVSIRSLFSFRRAGEPAVVKGSLIWGSAKDFGTHAVEYLHHCQRSYGDVFTLRLFNQYLTIFMNPNEYDEFGKTKSFDFNEIQKVLNWNVFNYVIKNPVEMVNATIRAHRGSKMHRDMEYYCRHLSYAFDNVSRESGGEWKVVPVREFCVQTAYNAIFNTIFGRSDDQCFNSYMVQKNLNIFHQSFNYLWLGIPKVFFPKAMRCFSELIDQPSSADMVARKDCSEYIKLVSKLMKDEGQSESDIARHNLVYLHVNYNTLKLCFWIMNNIIHCPKSIAEIREEVEKLIRSRVDGNHVAAITMPDVEKMSVLGKIDT